MKKLLLSAKLALSSIRLMPHVVVVLALDRDGCIGADIERWAPLALGRSDTRSKLHRFARLMTFFPEFRNLFYFRTGWKGQLLAPLCRPMPSLVLGAGSIGPGFFIQHGLATIVAAKKIGKNCWVNQQVTIGFLNVTDCPTLGDDVRVCAGAKILGDVTVGDHFSDRRQCGRGQERSPKRYCGWRSRLHSETQRSASEREPLSRSAKRDLVPSASDPARILPAKKWCRRRELNPHPA